MRFDIFTLFPGMFAGAFAEGVVARARERGGIEIQVHDLRQYAAGKHRVTDDYAYGGGGMVMKPEPIFAAVEAVLGEERAGCPVILLSPQGETFTQAMAWELARERRLALICGRYEGVDERVREHLATREVSIGDYVLSGGEIPAMVVVDAVARLVPGVLGDAAAALQESHSLGLLEHPHYTRPAVFRGWGVPEVLLSGDHQAVARWRRQEALRRTWERRAELLERAELTSEDRDFLALLAGEGGAEAARCAAWHEEDGPAFEHVRVWMGAGGGQADGLLVVEEDGRMVRLRYRIRWRAGWELAEAEMERLGEGARLRLGRDEEGGWWQDGRRRPELAACRTVDLAGVVFTNTLAIGVLGLAVGERRTLPVAYVDLPRLAVRPVEQTYERIGPDLYRYQVPGLRADLQVDGDLLVLDYPGYRRRVWPRR